MEPIHLQDPKPAAPQEGDKNLSDNAVDVWPG